jgi:hypothetical protein
VTDKRTTATRERHSWLDDGRVRKVVTVLAIGLLLFNPAWTTIRFSSLFGRFLSMQLAYDEPFYFWQIQEQVARGVLDMNYRLLAKLPGALLFWLGASFDTVLTVYGLLCPVLAFASALYLASIWERRSIGRVLWALFLLLGFDFLSGGSRVIDYEPPAVWLANLVGDPGLLRADILSFFLIHRRPEPQMSWIVIFLYFALLLGAFLNGNQKRYRLVCVLTPCLVFVYINVAIAAIMVFGLLSLCSLIVYRRPILLPFALSVVVTLAAYGLSFVATSTSTAAALTVFKTHLPMLRPSIGFGLAGLIWVGMQMRRHGTTPQRWAAAAFFVVPIVVLNQQIVTGLAVTPQNWDIYINYVCLVTGAGLMSGDFLSTLERRRDWRQFLPLGVIAFIGFILVQGGLRNEIYWQMESARSVLFADVYEQAQAKAPVDAVILPHLFDESLFLTRVPRGVVVLGGYNSMILDPVPPWRPGESFEDHATAAGRSFATGFDVLFRSGVAPEQLQKNMEAELKTGDCWFGLSYFFSIGDCWPALLNFTSQTTKRLPPTVPAIIAMYRRYLEQDAARDLAQRRVLLIRNQPLAGDAGGPIDNELVATAEVDLRGTPVRVYGYLQRPRAR